MSKTHLYMADVRYIRRQLAEVEAALAYYERNPEARGAALRVGYTSCSLAPALARANKALRRFDRETVDRLHAAVMGELGGAP